MPSEKRRRINRTTPLGFSPFLRCISRMDPHQKHPTKSPPSFSSSPLEETNRYEKGGEVEEVKEESFASSSSSSSDEEEDATVLQLGIAFSDPTQSHFHGVKLLLNNYLDLKPWDMSGFVDLILEQTTVGTVAKAQFEVDNVNDDTEYNDNGDDDDDDSVFAVVSVLNLGRYETHKSIKDVKEYVLGVCKDEAVKVKLDLLLKEQAKDVGLLVCERAVNFAYEAVVPLYTGLFDEIGWATEDEPTQEFCDSFRFKFYLMVTKIYVNKNSIGGNCKRKPKKAASKLKNKGSSQSKTGSFEDDSIVYIKLEDEIFHKLSTINFTFDLHPGQPVPPELKNFKKMGLLMVMESKKVPDFNRDLKQLVES